MLVRARFTIFRLFSYLDFLPIFLVLLVELRVDFYSLFVFIFFSSFVQMKKLFSADIKFRLQQNSKTFRYKSSFDVRSLRDETDSGLKEFSCEKFQEKLSKSIFCKFMQFIYNGFCKLKYLALVRKTFTQNFCIDNNKKRKKCGSA